MADRVVRVTLTERATGRTVAFEHTASAHDEIVRYVWGPDGNYGCDCNRRLLWRRHHDRVTGAPDDCGPCGDGAYGACVEDGGHVLHAD